MHALLKPSIETVETFLADEAQEMELAAAEHLLTMSQNKPSPASDSSSEERERQRQDEEYQRMVEEELQRAALLISRFEPGSPH